MNNELMCQLLSTWDNTTLTDEDLVYRVKDILNAVNQLTPLMAKSGTFQVNDYLDADSNWNRLDNNRMYTFRALGGYAAPDVTKLGSNNGFVFNWISPDMENLMQLVLPFSAKNNQPIFAFRTGLKNLTTSSWQYFNLRASNSGSGGGKGNGITLSTTVLKDFKNAPSANTMYRVATSDGNAGVYLSLQDMVVDETTSQETEVNVGIALGTNLLQLTWDKTTYDLMLPFKLLINTEIKKLTDQYQKADNRLAGEIAKQIADLESKLGSQGMDSQGVLKLIENTLNLYDNNIQEKLTAQMENTNSLINTGVNTAKAYTDSQLKALQAKVDKLTTAMDNTHKYWQGTQAEYDALDKYDNNTWYLVTKD